MGDFGGRFSQTGCSASFGEASEHWTFGGSAGAEFGIGPV